MTVTAPEIGDPAPWFPATAGYEPRSVAWDEWAGRVLCLLFFGSAARAEVAALLSNLSEAFDGERRALIGVSGDGDDFRADRLPRSPGAIFILDAGGAGAARYGVTGADDLPLAFVLSPQLQILRIVRCEPREDFARRLHVDLDEAEARLPPPSPAPALVVPQVFDAGLRRRLIELYEASGGRQIGLIERKGQIVAASDDAHRKRRDYYVADEAALRDCQRAIERRLLPMVYRAFQFATTRIERYLVGCYDSSSGGFFRPHRDNAARPVAHRRFALTLPLNDDFEGGHLRFPEFGGQTFAPAAGDAVVFSCSLLHEVTPVTAGRRYAFISFFYDEQGQKMRDALAGQAPRPPA